MQNATKTENSCLFCSMPRDNWIYENELFFVMRDKFPVTDKHTLIIPKRHCETAFDLNEEEFTKLFSLLQRLKADIEKDDPSVSGFNIGMNAGADAGQTVMHCHIHLIPRRKGDTPAPRGGVRGVIPGKQAY